MMKKYQCVVLGAEGLSIHRLRWVSTNHIVVVVVVVVGNQTAVGEE